MSKIKDLNEQRRKAVADARAISEAAEKDNKRALTTEESKNFDAAMDKADALDKEIKQEIRLATAEAALAEVRTDSPDAPAKDEKRDEPVELDAHAERRSKPEYRKMFRRWIGQGREALFNAPEGERRALQSDLDVQGGFMVAPLQMAQGLIKAVDNMVFFRQLATKETVTSAAGLGILSLDADPADPAWTAEIGTGDEDSSMGFGGREVHPHPVAKRIKVSNKLMRQRPDVESLVMSRLAYKFAVTEESAYMTGHGAGQPLGVFTASDSGIPTSRDVSTGNSTSEIAADNLINVKYTLKSQYWPTAQWIFHRDAVKQLAKLKDGNGQYLWRESLRAGEPDVVCGRPMNVSEYAPNTFTTGLYVGIFGAFQNYVIVDALDMSVQRLVELYAATNQTGFIGRREVDGQPVLSEAFVRVKLA